jgi:hypothetical protein
MKRLAVFAFACAILSGGFLSLVQAQGRKGSTPKQSATSKTNQSALFYQAAALQRQQQAAINAALARRARLQATARRPSTMVIRTTTSIGGKGAKPLVLSTQTTSSLQQRGPTSTMTVKSTVKGPGFVAPAYLAPGFFGYVAPGYFAPGFLAANAPGKYQFKETWAFGSGKNAVKNLFTEKVSIKGGKETIQQNWSTKASSPALASLPLQLQMNALENLLPYQAWYPYRPWNVYRPWQPWYYPYNPLVVGAAGKKTSRQSTASWQGGSEKVKTSIVNQYDKSGRYVGAQVQVKDTLKGNGVVVAPLSPQAQLNLLEVAANPGLYPYAPLDPLAYTWAAPSYYYPDWRAIDRVALLEGLPIW